MIVVAQVSHEGKLLWTLDFFQFLKRPHLIFHPDQRACSRHPPQCCPCVSTSPEPLALSQLMVSACFSLWLLPSSFKIIFLLAWSESSGLLYGNCDSWGTKSRLREKTIQSQVLITIRPKLLQLTYFQFFLEGKKDSIRFSFILLMEYHQEFSDVMQNLVLLKLSSFWFL